MLEFPVALPSPSTLTAAFLLVLAVIYIRRHLGWTSRSRGRPLPPGPPGLPIIGNVLDIPKFKMWLGFQELSGRYGDILHLNVLGDSTVVLGNAELALEYLEKRSAVTSDRKQSALIELAGFDLNFGMFPYGSSWKRHRRAFWEHFRPPAIVNYQSTQKAVTAKLLGKLLERPLDFKDHIRFNFAATLMKLLYDIQVADQNDAYIAKVERFMVGFNEALVPGNFLVEFFPVLRHLPAWLPGAGFQRRFASWRAASRDLKNAPVAHVQEAMEQQEGRPCIVRELLSRLSDTGLEGHALAEEEDLVRNVAAVAFVAGADTMSSTLESIFHAMSLYPDVLKKAHAELDAVVGPTRLPDFGDKDSLVYVNAIIREALRWIPVGPLGVPHCTSEDDELRGYFIPKGTVVMANVWAIMHDPEAYPDPDVFLPERFIRDGKLDGGDRDPYQFAFGFGRRICPGRYYAESALFILVASVLHVFDIGPPLNESGVAIKVAQDVTDGFVARPKDCRCTIKPRSPGAEQLILRSVQGANAE